MQLKVQLAVGVYSEIQFKTVLFFLISRLVWFIIHVVLSVLQDMMNKVRSATLLDMNFEKSHVKELVCV